MEGKKIERLLGIIFLLVNREKMTSKELAELFSVSVKTIYRDIETLSLANIPVISYPGIKGGYGIMSDFVVDKSMFSNQEIVSTLSVLGSVNSFFSDPGISLVAEKMSALISADKRNEIKKRAGEMVFDLSAWGDGEGTRNKLNIIRSAIRSQNCLDFYYTNRCGENSKRIIEPITVFFKERYWYVKGYCRTKEEIRSFKLSRIGKLSQTQEMFNPDNHKNEDISDSARVFVEDRFIDVLIKFHPSIRGFIEDYIDSGAIYEENDILYAKLHYPEGDFLYNMLLGFGAGVEIIQPEYLRGIICEKAKRVYELYCTETL